MAAGISTIANVQLSLLQSPEIARQEAPILAQAQLANAQVPAIVAKGDRDASETIQMMQPAGWRGIAATGDGATRRERPAYREPVRPPRLREKAVTLAGAHPLGLGALVDVRA